MKFRTIEEKIYVISYRIARIKARGGSGYADWQTLYEENGYGHIYQAANDHLNDLRDYQWMSSAWTPAQYRYFRSSQ